MSERKHDAWVIATAGEDVTRRFDAPEAVAGWDERPWVRLRPLTAREALRRDSLGLEESYELGPDGAAREMRRRYDHEAMMQYELQRCLVDWELPMATEDGTAQAAGPEELGREELLDRLPTGLMAWLVECLDTVNMRRAADAEVLAQTKKD